SSEWSRLKVWGLVFGVMASLVGLLILVALLLNPFLLFPAGFLVGGWLVRVGLDGYVNSNSAEQPAASKAGSARPGLVQLQGRAVSASSTAAAITGRPSVWWDVAVFLLYNDEGRGVWRQVAARYGGSIDVVELADETGRVTVWLKDAQLLLEKRAWESTKDALPDRGVAFLDELGFPWAGATKVRVVEQSLAIDATLYVLGTLDERRNVVPTRVQSFITNATRQLRTGEWKRTVVAAVPRSGRVLVTVLISYLEMITQIGTAKERPLLRGDSKLPAIGPTERMIWKGRAGRPFLVSDLPKQGALESLRQRSIVVGGLGLLLLGYLLFQLLFERSSWF
ncbi:MAG: hypothetical protein M3081_21745, partial [Gemmatimonadota bacterium]|nr:hypothetical protein [Gemmatimonadota bacterium]